MLDIQLRRAEAADIKDIDACDDRVFGWLAAGYAAKDLGPGGEFGRLIGKGALHVVCDAGRIVGYVSFAQHFDYLFVATLAVLPKYQGRGLGRKLLEHAEQEARNLGLKGVSLFADGSLDGTLAFYRSCGFEETSRCIDTNFSRVFFNKPIAA